MLRFFDCLLGYKHGCLGFGFAQVLQKEEEEEERGIIAQYQP